MANIDYDDFKGKLGVGRIHSGSLRKGQAVGLGRPEEDVKTGKVAELFVFDNLGRTVSAIENLLESRLQRDFCGHLSLA